MFDKVTCERCNGTRILGEPCPECGKKQPVNEVNAKVVERRTALATIDQLVRQRSKSVGPSSDGIPSLSDLGDAVSSLISGVDSFLKTNGSDATVNSLATAVAVIVSMQDRCDSAPRRRPYVASYDATKSIVDDLYKLWPLYRDALGASRIQDAQRLALQAQHLIDGCGRTMGEYNEKIRAVRDFESDGQTTLFERALKVLSLSYPNMNVLAVDSVGAQEAESDCGVAIAAGHGAQYLIARAVADVHLDPTRFHAVIKDAAGLCMTSEALTSVAQSADALSALGASTRRMYEAVFTFEAILEREKDEDALLRRIIKFYAEVFEEVAAPIFAWYSLLTGIKLKSFSKLIELDATSLASSLESSPRYGSLFAGARAYLRNAAQHGNSYEITEGSVHFRLRSFRGSRLKEEIIDDVYTFLESIIATSWALTNALSVRGFPVQLDPRDADYMGISDFRIAQLVADQIAGLRASRDDGNRWTFVIDDALKSRDLAIALASTHRSQTQLECISVTPSEDETPTILSLHDYLSITSKDGVEPLERMVGGLELVSSFSLNGAPLLSPGGCDYVLACVGIHALSDPPPMIPLLRRLLTLTRRVGDTSAEKLVKRVFTVSRSRDPKSSKLLAAELLTMTKETRIPDVPQPSSIMVLLDSRSPL